MKKYYINSIQEQPSQLMDQRIYQLTGKEATKDSKKVVVYGKTYELLKKLPPDNEGVSPVICGYIHADRKEKDSVKWNKNNQSLTHNLKTFANIYDQPQMRIIGYLKSTKNNEYFAVTRPLFCLPFWIVMGFILFTILISMMILPNTRTDTIIFGDDITSQGEIANDEIGSLDTEYFNIIINTTPIVEDGKMNIRIENSQRNSLACHVKIITDIDGVETVIYHSPLMKPNSSIENATLIHDLSEGAYHGKAIFTYFDEEEKPLDVTTNIQLMMNVRE